MTTLLEFVIERVLGAPNRSSGNGESYWDCPNCGKEKFHTMPSKEGHKDRFYCWVCDYRGDVFDFLQNHGTPEERASYTERKRSVAYYTEVMFDECARVRIDGQAATKQTHRPDSDNTGCQSFPPGNSSAGSDGEPTQSAAFIWDSLTSQEHELIRAAFRLAVEKGVSLASLAMQIPIDEQHRMECTDPGCDWWICVAARRAKQGLPPMTREERQKELSEEKRKRIQKQREWQELLRTDVMPWAFKDEQR